MGVQVCRLPALKRLKPFKPSKRLKPLKPSKPWKTVKPFKRWLGMLHPAANSHPEATHQWLLLATLAAPQGHTSMASCGHSCSQPPPQSHTSMALTWHASSCSQQPPRGHTSMASSGHSCSPPRPHINSFLWASKSAVCQLSNPPHPRATHQWLLMGVHVCRLPALKPSKRSKRLKPSKQPPRATHQWLLVATLAVNRHPRATHQWLLMGVHVCHLPALKRSKRSKRLKPSKPTHLAAIKPHQ